MNVISMLSMFLGLLSAQLAAAQPTSLYKIEKFGVPSVLSCGSKRTLVLAAPSARSLSSFTWPSYASESAEATNRVLVVVGLPASGLLHVWDIAELGRAMALYSFSSLVSAQTADSPALLTESAQSTPASSANEAVAYDVGRGGFAPSGWMGDGAKSGFTTEISDDAPPNARGSRRWKYQPVKRGTGWAAVAYQYPPNNWGDKEGRNLSGKGFTEVSVWARGVPDKDGHYPVIQFKAGGGADPSKKVHASFEAEGDFVTLTGEWKRYTISLAGKNLSSVISAFTFVLRAEDNPHGAEFLLAQIEYR